MRALLVCLLAVLPSVAVALPGVEFKGTLLKDGAGVTGPTDLEIRIYESKADGDPIWTETHEGVALPMDAFPSCCSKMQICQSSN